MSMRVRHTVVPAAYVVLRSGDKVLLARRFKTGYMDGMYSLPSGHVDGGEPADVAACREAKEEIGLDLNPADLRLVHAMHRKAQEDDHERVDFFFAVTKWAGEPTNMEPDKCDELKWVNITELPENTIGVVRQAIENIEKDVPFSSFNFG